MLIALWAICYEIFNEDKKSLEHLCVSLCVFIAQPTPNDHFKTTSQNFSTSCVGFCRCGLLFLTASDVWLHTRSTAHAVSYASLTDSVFVLHLRRAFGRYVEFKPLSIFSEAAREQAACNITLLPFFKPALVWIVDNDVVLRFTFCECDFRSIDGSCISTCGCAFGVAQHRKAK